MKAIKLFGIQAFALGLLGFLLMDCSVSTAQNVKAADSMVITISGKIAMKGSAPYAYLGLVTEDRIEYRLVGALESLLRKQYQQQRVVLAGVVRERAIGPGFPARFEVIAIQEILKSEPLDRM